MSPVLTSAIAFALGALALLLVQQNGLLHAIKGFFAALLILSASSLGADILFFVPETIRSMIAPAIVRVVVCSTVLICGVLIVPRMLASIDRIWVIWNLLAISEISSLVYRGVAFEPVELVQSGILVIIALTLASISFLRISHRHQAKDSRNSWSNR